MRLHYNTTCLERRRRPTDSIIEPPSRPVTVPVPVPPSLLPDPDTRISNSVPISRIILWGDWLVEARCTFFLFFSDAETDSRFHSVHTSWFPSSLEIYMSHWIWACVCESVPLLSIWHTWTPLNLFLCPSKPIYLARFCKKKKKKKKILFSSPYLSIIIIFLKNKFLFVKMP